jgi:chemotaxis protein CheD
MDDPPEVHVRMGELALGQGPTILKATLGSCVGIALVWRARDRSALAHCLLPYAPDSNMPSGARYVDQAIKSLLRLLEARPEHHAHIEAHLAGGANMSRRAGSDSRTPMVGQINVDAVLHLLHAQGIAVHSKDLGGTCARQMRLDCATAVVSVACVPAP